MLFPSGPDVRPGRTGRLHRANLMASNGITVIDYDVCIVIKLQLYCTSL